jgi:hypothetical protein
MDRPTGSKIDGEHSIAVGEKAFVIETKAKLSSKAIGRKELENSEGYVEMTAEN